jgi:hypothetical protein
MILGWTRMAALAVRPLAWPTAMIVCVPEMACGTLKVATKEPAPVVVGAATGTVAVTSR